MATEQPWIEWTGGECPVHPDTIVDVRFPSGVTMEGYPASDWSDGPSDWWQRDGRANDHLNIAAYRVVAA